VQPPFSASEQASGSEPFGDMETFRPEPEEKELAFKIIFRGQ
jgi:hypothetical protein